MNFKNFKKVHDDDDKAILKNEMGHSITIAKKSLSKEHAKGLNDLPLYQADPDSEVTAPDDGSDELPPQVGTQAPEVGDAPAAEPESRGLASPKPKRAPMQQQQAQAPDESQPEMPQAQGQTMVQAAQQQAQGYNALPANATQEDADNYNKQALLTAQDIASGHITPETYHSLFAKKDTLGKIGTLFGLLVGGAGAGLTHSGVNPVLSMMDKQIANDMDAQKTSKANAQNFIKMNQANELLKADIPNKVATGKLTAAQTKGALAAASLDADTHTMNQMKITKLASLMGLVNKIPPGSPQAAAAQQALKQVEAHTMQSIQQTSQAAAQQKAAIRQFSNDQQANMMLGMSDIASDNNSKFVPGFGSAGKPVPESTQKELTARLDYEKAAQEYVQFAQDHQGNWAKWAALHPTEAAEVMQKGANMGKILQSKYMAAHPGFGSIGERKQLEETIPSNAVGIMARFKQIPKVQETIHSNRMSADTTAQEAALPDRPWKSDEPDAPTKKSAAPAQSETRWYNGKKYRRGPNGKSVLVQ